ncbi:MAG: CopG family transcriptional regulator, partial [Halobacteria archaeon]|nr:CopG family transcriptional regulator [Halobacteria archaeon]
AVSLVPDERVDEEGEEFPPKVKVPKQVLRENERLELENKHLREQLDEHKEYINKLKDQIENDDVEHVMLGNVDSEYR